MPPWMADFVANLFVEFFEMVVDWLGCSSDRRTFRTTPSERLGHGRLRGRLLPMRGQICPFLTTG